MKSMTGDKTWEVVLQIIGTMWNVRNTDRHIGIGSMILGNSPWNDENGVKS